MRYQNQQVYQNIITRCIDLKVLEQNINSKELERFINYIAIIHWGERIISGPVKFGFYWNDWQSAGKLGYKRFIICWMLGLKIKLDLPFWGLISLIWIYKITNLLINSCFYKGLLIFKLLVFKWLLSTNSRRFWNKHSKREVFSPKLGPRSGLRYSVL